jgi:hypothetical protein
MKGKGERRPNWNSYGCWLLLHLISAKALAKNAPTLQCLRNYMAVENFR